MQAFIELLAGFMALLVVACLSQFGVNLQASPKAEREVHRVFDCNQPTATVIGNRSDPDC